jgi:hypothetical protein
MADFTTGLDLLHGQHEGLSAPVILSKMSSTAISHISISSWELNNWKMKNDQNL